MRVPWDAAVSCYSLWGAQGQGDRKQFRKNPHIHVKSCLMQRFYTQTDRHTHTYTFFFLKKAHTHTPEGTTIANTGLILKGSYLMIQYRTCL